MIDFMVAYGLLFKNQHGFVPRKSCVTNLIQTLDILTNKLSIGNDVDEILLELSKAFNLVSNNRIIYKIKVVYGLSEDLTNWIKDFLSCRTQRVVLGEIKSEWRVVCYKDLCLVNFYLFFISMIYQTELITE